MKQKYKDYEDCCDHEMEPCAIRFKTTKTDEDEYVSCIEKADEACVLAFPRPPIGKIVIQEQEKVTDWENFDFDSLNL